MLHYFNWRDVLSSLCDERLIGRSMHRYLGELIVDNLEKRVLEVDELDQVLILEALKKIYSAAFMSDEVKLSDIRQRLAKLKKKHRKRLSTQRKRLIAKWR